MLTEIPHETHILSVESLNKELKSLIETNFKIVWVKGEISNFKAHSSGHFYFSLKDDRAQIRAVMFKGHNSRLKFVPKDGQEVLVRGKITVYEPRGDYQIMCETMEPVGAGALQKAFEELKEKLYKEGLFDPTKKRKLPSFPKQIALVTSPTGAAIKDMLNIISRRNKMVEVTLVPTLVQGAQAAPQIVEALAKAIKLPNVDVIIVGRGGGSIEDMWCFNDEKLARAIAQCPIPVVSAVGHEIDFTICDFVADVRAPTPSAAAELVVSNTADIVEKINSLKRILWNGLNKVFQNKKQSLAVFDKQLIDPRRKLQDLMIKNDDLFMRLDVATKNFFKQKRLKVEVMLKKLPSPFLKIEKLFSKLSTLKTRLSSQARAILENKKARIQKGMALLNSISPLQVLDRGYSIVCKGDKIIKGPADLNLNEEVNIFFAKGSAQVKVQKLDSDKKLIK